MAEYVVEFTRSARRELEGLDAPAVQRVFAKVEALANVPRPRGCRKLMGSRNRWRIRVGEYRVIYEIDDSRHVVGVMRIRHRKEA
jgi:mRNA interferase RelE/StbE